MRKEDILRLALRSLQLLEEGFPGHLEQLEKPKARIEGFPVTSSMKAFNTLAVYANLANMDFLVSKLQGQGVQVSGTIRTMEQYENRLLNTFEQRREAILAEIERGLRELLDQFESAIRLIDPIAKRFPYDTDHEFESDVFVTRELVEFAAMAAAKLNHRYDFQSYLERFMSRDETLRAIIPFAVVQLVRLGGHVDPPELHPERFWWRRDAWESYERYARVEDP